MESRSLVWPGRLSPTACTHSHRRISSLVSGCFACSSLVEHSHLSSLEVFSKPFMLGCWHIEVPEVADSKHLASKANLLASVAKGSRSQHLLPTTASAAATAATAAGTSLLSASVSPGGFLLVTPLCSRLSATFLGASPPLCAHRLSGEV